MFIRYYSPVDGHLYYFPDTSSMTKAALTFLRTSPGVYGQ